MTFYDALRSLSNSFLVTRLLSRRPWSPWRRLKSWPHVEIALHFRLESKDTSYHATSRMCCYFCSLHLRLERSILLFLLLFCDCFIWESTDTTSTHTLYVIQCISYTHISSIINTSSTDLSYSSSTQTHTHTFRACTMHSSTLMIW